MAPDLQGRSASPVSQAAAAGLLASGLAPLRRIGGETIRRFGLQPAQSDALAGSLGLEILALQPFRDFEGLPEPQRTRAFERARRKLELMGRLGTKLLLVCSSVSPDAIDDLERVAADLHELGELAAPHGITIGFEALCWGRHINDYRQAWEAVRKADHPQVGLILDTFHALARRCPIEPIAEIPGDRIVLVQTADAPAIARHADDEGVWRVPDARLATIYARANGFRDVWNVLACEPALLKFLARDRGWSLAANLSEASQRKIVDLLVPLYRQKGTLPGMVNVVRLFLGIEPRVRALYAGAWRLNRSRLGGYRTRYTAAGGETEIDLAAVSPAWSSVPYAGELRVWRNGTELAATEFHMLSPTRVLVRTQGVLVVGLRTIPIASLFGFTPNNGEVVVTKNGLALAAGQWSEAPTEITVNVTVAANDVISWKIVTLNNPGDRLMITMVLR